MMKDFMRINYVEENSQDSPHDFNRTYITFRRETTLFSFFRLLTKCLPSCSFPLPILMIIVRGALITSYPESHDKHVSLLQANVCKCSEATFVTRKQLIGVAVFATTSNTDEQQSHAS